MPEKVKTTDDKQTMLKRFEEIGQSGKASCNEENFTTLEKINKLHLKDEEG